MSELNEKTLVMMPDGIYQQTMVRTRVNIPDEEISKALNLGWSVIPNASCPKGIPLTFSARAKEFSVHGILPSLRITAKYEIVNKKAHPCFRNAEKGSDMSYEWTPPSDMTLIFAVFGTYNGKQYQAVGGDAPGCYLLVGHSSKKGWFKLPTSNIYPDGRICMGGQVKAADTLDQLWLNAANLFAAGKYNADLGNAAAELSREMFGWDMDEKQIAVPKDWERLCTKINSTVYEHVR